MFCYASVLRLNSMNLMLVYIYLPCKRLFFLEKDYSLVFCVNVPRVTRNDVQAVFCGFHYFFVSAIKGRFWMIWLELIGLIKVTKSQNVFSISSHLQKKRTKLVFINFFVYIFNLVHLYEDGERYCKYSLKLSHL